MKNVLRVVHENCTLVMDRTFAKHAENTMSEEYAHLQMVRRDYPKYKVVVRQIKKNPDKKTYNGLTYEYMESYMLTHGSEETRKKNFGEYTEMRLIAECHSKAYRYPVIKSWFLEKYPEIAKFGLSDAAKVIEMGEPQEDDETNEQPQEPAA